jgi:cation transport ATPase
MFRRRFWWSLLLTVPVVATSHMVMGWFDYSLRFPGAGLVGPGLGSVLFVWGGWPFLTGGWSEARSRRPGMMLLIAMAISVAYTASLATTFGWFDLEFWWELAALITIMLLGRWQEMRALGQAGSALAALAELLPDEAERIGPGGSVETVPLDDLRPRVEAWKARGAAVLYLLRGDAIVGALALEDQIRPEARAAVTELRRLGVRVVMITGDARNVAESVGRELGVDGVMAEVLPEDKDARVVELQGRGLSLAMVGDGVNDTPALARADVGIAVGAGTDVAIESADVILASNDPLAVVSLIRLSAASYRKMAQNLAWAAGYNIVAIPWRPVSWPGPG